MRNKINATFINENVSFLFKYGPARLLAKYKEKGETNIAKIINSVDIFYKPKEIKIGNKYI